MNIKTAFMQLLTQQNNEKLKPSWPSVNIFSIFFFIEAFYNNENKN